MAINIHKAKDRGLSELDWLESHFSFSFADYHDSNRMGFGKLRVLNDDTIAQGAGFGMHPHKNFEIITIPLAGKIQHKDSEGNTKIIGVSEVQHMSAGSGIIHSEFNPSKKEETKLLQIWVEPKKMNLTPVYNQKKFLFSSMENKFCEIVSGQGKKGSIKMNQEGRFLLGKFDENKTEKIIPTSKENGLFVFMIGGEADLITSKKTTKKLFARDSAEITNEKEITIKTKTSANILVIEVPLS